MARVMKAEQSWPDYEELPALNEALTAAHDGLLARIDELVGSGSPLDVGKLRDLAAFIESTVIPAAGAYELLLAGAHGHAARFGGWGR